MAHEIILGVFPGDVEQGLTQLKRYHEIQDEIGINDAVAIWKTDEGKDKFEWLGGKKKATEIGAIAGAALGLLGGPATMIVMGAGGAAAGNLIASLTHAGISKKTISGVEKGLEPGSSAVLVVVDHGKHQVILNDLKHLGAHLYSDTVDSDEVEGKYMISPVSGMGESQ
ncbi:MAG TPA: DUF1269 domain-containing protein [Patescibacteria group bacterium]|jgi:uncharacterized membrane protein|nr:DUF1269 domain-containing protein [Patescibacteria group bacterium]